MRSGRGNRGMRAGAGVSWRGRGALGRWEGGSRGYHGGNFAAEDSVDVEQEEEEVTDERGDDDQSQIGQLGLGGFGGDDDDDDDDDEEGGRDEVSEGEDGEEERAMRAAERERLRKMYLEASRTHPDHEHAKVMKELRDEKDAQEFVPDGALVLVHEGADEIDAVTMTSVLRSAKIGVEITSLTENRTVQCMRGFVINADSTLNSLADVLGYVGIVVLGADDRSTQRLCSDERVVALLQAYDTRRRLICSMGSGALVLKEAGVLYGRKYTAPPELKNELPDLDADIAVRVDEHILTCQGGGTAMECALSIVELYKGQEYALKMAYRLRYPKLEHREVHLMAPVTDEQLDDDDEAQEVRARADQGIVDDVEILKPHPASLPHPKGSVRGSLGTRGPTKNCTNTDIGERNAGRTREEQGVKRAADGGEGSTKSARSTAAARAEPGTDRDGEGREGEWVEGSWDGGDGDGAGGEGGGGEVRVTGKGGYLEFDDHSRFEIFHDFMVNMKEAEAREGKEYDGARVREYEDVVAAEEAMNMDDFVNEECAPSDEEGTRPRGAFSASDKDCTGKEEEEEEEKEEEEEGVREDEKKMYDLGQMREGYDFTADEDGKHIFLGEKDSCDDEEPQRELVDIDALF